jgi:hypothetical protein
MKVIIEFASPDYCGGSNEVSGGKQLDVFGKQARAAQM